MSVKDQQEKVKEVLAMCELHWAVNRIPEDKVLEMSAELEQHLREALRDGKPVEAVVGPDESAFAEAWAEESRPSMSLVDRAVELAYLLCVMAVFITTTYMLFMWSTTALIRWFEVVFVLTYSTYLSRPTIKPEPRIEPRWKRWLVVGVPALAIVGGAWGLSVLTLGSGNAVLIEWPWYATLLATVVAVFLSRLRQQTRSQTEQA